MTTDPAALLRSFVEHLPEDLAAYAEVSCTCGATDRGECSSAARRAALVNIEDRVAQRKINAAEAFVERLGLAVRWFHLELRAVADSCTCPGGGAA